VTVKIQQIGQGQADSKYSKGFNSWAHLALMLIFYFTKNQAVRDISNGLRLATGNLNHVGMEQVLSMSTVSYQNEWC